MALISPADMSGMRKAQEEAKPGEKGKVDETDEVNGTEEVKDKKD